MPPAPPTTSEKERERERVKDSKHGTARLKMTSGKVGTGAVLDVLKVDV